jgi:hypothetical protein
MLYMSRQKDWVEQERVAMKNLPEALEIVSRALWGRASNNELRRVADIIDEQGSEGKRQFTRELHKMLSRG